MQAAGWCRWRPMGGDRGSSHKGKSCHLLPFARCLGVWAASRRSGSSLGRHQLYCRGRGRKRGGAGRDRQGQDRKKDVEAGLDIERTSFPPAHPFTAPGQAVASRGEGSQGAAPGSTRMLRRGNWGCWLAQVGKLLFTRARARRRRLCLVVCRTAGTGAKKTGDGRIHRSRSAVACTVARGEEEGGKRIRGRAEKATTSHAVVE